MSSMIIQSYEDLDGKENVFTDVWATLHNTRVDHTLQMAPERALNSKLTVVNRTVVQNGDRVRMAFVLFKEEVEIYGVAGETYDSVMFYIFNGSVPMGVVNIGVIDLVQDRPFKMYSASLSGNGIWLNTCHRCMR